MTTSRIYYICSHDVMYTLHIYFLSSVSKSMTHLLSM